MIRSVKAYICPYHHSPRAPRDWSLTSDAARLDPLLGKFLKRYAAKDSYLDWGDDPGFFCAEELLGDVRLTSWGVCRRDVRSRLGPGDLVIFFCAKRTPRTWEYFYIGFGTVQACLTREQVWQDSSWEPYRRFYNILGRPGSDGLVQHETFYPYHPDWRNRLSAPYVIFEPQALLSNFNLTNPFHVASYTPGNRVPERWRSHEDPLVAELESLLFIEAGLLRRLRTSPTGFAHVPLSLHNHLGQGRLYALRDKLGGLVVPPDSRR
jgi:hypothetical protein